MLIKWRGLSIRGRMAVGATDRRLAICLAADRPPNRLGKAKIGARSAACEWKSNLKPQREKASPKQKCLLESLGASNYDGRHFQVAAH